LYATSNPSSAGLAIDDDTANWPFYGMSCTFNQYVELDLGAVSEVHSVEVHHGNANNFSETIEKLEVLSHNGGCYETASNGTIQNPANTTLNTLNFSSPVITDKIKIRC